MLKTTVYLLEDEIITQELVRQTLLKYNFDLVGMSDNAEEAYKEIETLKPDLVLLDINVKGEKTGLWLAKLLIDTTFIFLTAYADVSTLQNALKTHPASYLVKPYSEMQLIAAIELALNKEEVKSMDKKDEVVVKDGYEYVKINIDDVLYVESDNNYIVIYTQLGKRHVIRETLTSFLEKTGENKLARTHRSFIINLQHVAKITSDYAVVENHKIPITRNFKDVVKKQFLNLKRDA